MSRSTIDFGIDLGTTNSEIAVFKGTETEIIKNNENWEATPSAVWIDSKGRTFVGRQAKEKHFSDEANAKIEFKREMGKAEPIVFTRSGRKMLPEELSAEVLKQLKANVKQWLGEEITAAVIAVPARFNADQREATNRAARLAGIEMSPLLQEPVAAAMAYGFQATGSSDRVRWLVYDLGGGTFDAALIHKEDGLIRVENHGGDKYLGGKDLDEAIVQALFVPALVKAFRLSNFTRDNSNWREAFAKLKIEAEKTKIQLSRAQTATLIIENLCTDDQGQTVEFEIDVERGDIERLAEPLIAKSINICKAVLAGKRLGPGDIEKVILVGGPTLMPYLRERLADKARGLGIPLEFGVDPFTVVARGAALFAGTQPLASTGPLIRGEYQVKLDYKAIGPELDPLVSGQVLSKDGEDLSDFSIEFVNHEARPLWRSGKIRLSAAGGFMATMLAEPRRQNRFVIELVDGRGVRQKTTPEDFPYTVGDIGVSAQILMHTIGVGLADNSVEVFFEKGIPLPARCRKLLHTTIDVKRGSSADAIKVPVMEGEEVRADRNEIVGSFEIPAIDFKRDVPSGTDVAVTIEVDESQRFLTKVFIPLLDEEFETVLIGTTVRAAVDRLAEVVEKEKKRLAELRDKARQSNDPGVLEKLLPIEEKRLEHDVDSSLAAARNDQDAGDKCASRLRDLQIALDAVEESLKWPDLVAKAEQQIQFTNNIVQKHANPADRELATILVTEVREAIEQHDPGLLESRSEALASFALRIWRETPDFWMQTLAWLQTERHRMLDRSAADKLLAEGIRAINARDMSGMRAAAQQLRELLPISERESGPFGGMSTLGRRA